MVNVPQLNQPFIPNLGAALDNGARYKTMTMQNKLAEAAALRQEKLPGLVQAHQTGTATPEQKANLVAFNPQVANMLASNATAAEKQKTERAGQILLAAQESEDPVSFIRQYGGGVFDAEDMEKLETAPPEAVQGFIKYGITKALGTSGAQTQMNNERDHGLALDRFDETQAQNAHSRNVDGQRLEIQRQAARRAAANAGAPNTNIGKLIAARDRLPEGHPNRAAFDAAITKATQSTGMSITTADGTTIQTGVPAGAMHRSTQKTVEGNILEADETLARLKGIGETFEEEYLTTRGRAKALFASGKDRLGIDLSEEDEAYLREFSQFKASAIANVNRTIQDLTGAAMGVQEAKRIISELPNPGSGLLDGDSPTQFKAKYDRVVRDVERARARAIYARNRGIGFETIPLGNMDSIMAERAKNLKEEVRQENPSASPSDITKEAKRRFRAEFGG